MAESSDAILDLHRRLRRGDRTASEELARQVLELLFDRVRRSYARVDEHTVMSGVADAVLEYCERPERLEVESGKHLVNHLSQAAWRNVANSLRGEKRRRAREQRYGEQAARGAVEQGLPAGILARKEEALERERRIDQLMQLFPDDKDREVLRIKLEGEKRTEVFAHALGIDHLPVEEQRKVVKRAKDRISKTIQRARR